MWVFRYVFLLLESPYTLCIAGGAGEGYLWMKILGPRGQLLFLCPEDPLLQLLEEGPDEVASCQHTITNHLDSEKREYCA